MGLLSHCWLLIEFFVFPNLSFFIHPFFLFFFRLYLWLLFPFQILCRLLSAAFPVRAEPVFYDAMDSDSELSPPVFLLIVSSEVRDLPDDCDGPRPGPVPVPVEPDPVAVGDNCDGNRSWLAEFLLSDRYTDAYLLSYGLDDDEAAAADSRDDYSDGQLLVLPFSDSADAAAAAGDSPLNVGGIKDSLFQRELAERFRFFNLLYHERLNGLGAISAERSMIGLSNSTNFIIDQIKTRRAKIQGSLQSDLELIYVAQTCLFWEALNHQYRQVEIRTFSEQTTSFHYIVAEKFQEFQILLERFVEEQKPGDRRSPNFIDQRLLFHATIQVPDVTGFVVDKFDSRTTAEEEIGSNKLLQAIKKCVYAFSSYVTTNDRKGVVGTVEDPVDLELLYDVTKALRKKGTMMKHLRGKKRCCLKRRVEPLRTEDEKINLLFATIDMKLVDQVLKMSLISGQQLEWCREKLNNLEFGQGRVLRSHMYHLFPRS
ncbi:uncharacterized protein LOC127242457 [Andrographis paniculata]|uniref:uncharacterized protein LOC127242457 n=1 Tax=Andrographis paniculata TaxID=175694 RepID=UPI0021E77017|nr:uncharacterized protein LOC127242457 [Andrographis paniculata]